MGPTPTVSVIVCVFNGAKYLGAAIETALAQTFGQFELIVVDDGSDDGSPDVVRSYADSRIRLLQQENRGAAAALETGLGIARGMGRCRHILSRAWRWPRPKLTWRTRGGPARRRTPH